MKMIANLIKVGNVIKYKDKTFQILGTNTIKPGKGGAFIQLEMRDLKSGSKVNERLRTSENIEKLNVNEISVTYLFSENNMKSEFVTKLVKTEDIKNNQWILLILLIIIISEVLIRRTKGKK